MAVLDAMKQLPARGSRGPNPIGPAVQAVDSFKNEVVNFYQQYCGRAFRDNDIVYTTSEVYGEYVSSVKLNCLGGAEYGGDFEKTPESAERSAGNVAVQAYGGWLAAPEASQPRRLANGGRGKDPETEARKRKAAAEYTVEAEAHRALGNFKTKLTVFLQGVLGRPLRAGDVVYAPEPVGDHYQSIVTLVCCDGQEFTGTLETDSKSADHAAARVALEQLGCPDAENGTAWEPPAPNGDKRHKAAFDETAKHQLTAVLQGLLGRPLSKSDVVYDTVQVGSLHQSTVRLMWGWRKLVHRNLGIDSAGG